MDREIHDMQCWIFRHAQIKWGLAPSDCAALFRKHNIFAFIAECYDILHLSSYTCALNDVEEFLKNRGVVV